MEYLFHSVYVFGLTVSIFSFLSISNKNRRGKLDISRGNVLFGTLHTYDAKHLSISLATVSLLSMFLFISLLYRYLYIYDIRNAACLYLYNA